jgi:tRNA A-37 threonylcarbamoyl transferase component Bud32
MSESFGPGDAAVSPTVIEEIERVCDRFEAAWRAGRQPRIEDELGGLAGPGRRDLLRALLAIELAYRCQYGERPTRREYYARFPDDAELVRTAFKDLRTADRPPAEPPRADGAAGADRNLLFGILALQMDFITRDTLIAALNAWVIEKHRPLGEILVGQGALAPEDRALLEPMVARHIQMHCCDSQRSLAALSSTGLVPTTLRRIADPDVQASLDHLGTARGETDGGSDSQDSALVDGESGSMGGRYRILRFHAEGGLGRVFVARDAELRREVALKQIKDEHADDPHRRARFLVEAEITGNLEHPGIVPVYGLGHHADGRPFYAMRLIQGDNLKEAIARFHRAEAPRRDPGERALELRRLLGRFLDVCNAVAYAHSRGVLHRDLKPGNIMLGKYGETLMVDWGLAKSVGRPDAARIDGERTLTPESGSDVEPTEVGARIGTPAFMSPEQAAGRLDELGPASDI